MTRSRPVFQMLLAVSLCGSLICGQTQSVVPKASTNSTTRAIDEFAAFLPTAMTPVVSPSIEVVAKGPKPPSSWREYRSDGFGFSFKYAPTFERSTTGPSDHFGVDCSSQNTVCLDMRREGGKEENFAVETTFSVTVTEQVSVRSCLTPPDAFRELPFSGKTAQSLAQLDGALFRKSDCSDAGLGTGVDCSRYDISANRRCYELISQLAAGCAGTTGQDQEACGAEVEAQDKVLKAILATFKFTAAVDAVDPRHPIANKIAYNHVSGYVRQTIENSDIAITFEYPNDPRWRFVDNEFQHALVGTIPLGGAQLGSHDFVSIAFNPRVYDTAKYFIKTNRMGRGWSLNGNYRYPNAPRGVWRVSAGPYASGYFILEYEATGQVGGTIALDINRCNAPSCIPIPGDILLFQFIDLNNDVARRFLSSLQVRINGTTDTIRLGERLSPLKGLF